IISKLNAECKSSLNKTVDQSDILGRAIIPSGIGVTPLNKPRIVDMIIPNKRAPLILRENKIAVIINPKIAIREGPENNCPIVTKVEGSATTILAFCKPINAINKPIPALIAVFKDIGIELTKVFLIGVKL